MIRKRPGEGTRVVPEVLVSPYVDPIRAEKLIVERYKPVILEMFEAESGHLIALRRGERHAGLPEEVALYAVCAATFHILQIGCRDHRRLVSREDHDPRVRIGCTETVGDILGETTRKTAVV